MIRKETSVLKLDNPATPAFCSSNRIYVGTLERIACVMGKLRMRKGYEETIQAWDAYLSGDKQANHIVGYSTSRLLNPAQLIRFGTLHLDAKEWEHTNVWGCPYLMRFSSAEVHELIIFFEGQYHRCIQARLHDLSYFTAAKQWSPLIDGFWGNDFIFEVEGADSEHPIVTTLLYEVEESDEILENLEDGFINPDKLNFSPICDEIFADG